MKFAELVIRSRDLKTLAFYMKYCLCASFKRFLAFFQVYIEVVNENDNVPLSEEPVYYPSIQEDSPSGSLVLQIRATDKDKDPNQKITYKITSGNPEGFFSINSTTGKN